MSKVIRVTLRLGPYDGDLILLGKQYRISEMVRIAIRYYLGISEERIPLPPMLEVPEETVYAVSFSESKSPEIVAFLSSLPSGYRSTIIKRLLRYAMEQCDIRSLLARKFVVRKRKKASGKLKASEKKPNISKTISEPLTFSQNEQTDEDDIFSGI